jgi:ribosomal protein L37AE/L43A
MTKEQIDRYFGRYFSKKEKPLPKCPVCKRNTNVEIMADFYHCFDCDQDFP